MNGLGNESNFDAELFVNITVENKWILSTATIANNPISEFYIGLITVEQTSVSIKNINIIILFYFF